MRVCLSSRQIPQYLKKADEIKVAYRDRDSIFDLIEEYPAATIVLDCNTDNIDWKMLEKYKILAKNRFIVCVNSINALRQANACGLRRYFGYPVSSFWELQALKTFDVEYILLDMELFFQMTNVKSYGIKIRAIPNLAYNDALPHQDGICGQWIRPEDLNGCYAEYIDTIEFADCDIKKEQALYRIYMEEKTWTTDLGIIITNLNVNVTNRMLTDALGPTRLNCNQKCLKGGHCKVCYHEFFLANTERITEYKAEVYPDIEKNI